MECIDRITVYYTTDNPHVQIELPSELVGLALIAASTEDNLVPDWVQSVESALNRLMKQSVSPNFDPYIAAFFSRDRLSIGFRVRVIHADKVRAIAEMTAEFLSALVQKMDYENRYGRVCAENCEVVVEQAPPEIAKYIIGAN